MTSTQRTTTATLLLSCLALLACADEDKDPCPKLTTGGPKNTPTVTEGSAPAATGGALASGVYHLTKSEVVLVEGADNEAVVLCSGMAQSQLQETLQVDAKSTTEGKIVLAARIDEATGIGTERAGTGSYTITGTTLSLSLGGTICETTLAPQVDGGATSTLVTSEATPSAQLRTFTSSETTLSFFDVLQATNDTPNCYAVSTYTKQ